jgi:dihydropteroate synthase
MGIVNVTPDSFSDGGENLQPERAEATARRLLAEGAAIVDVGGESTRPGADDVPLDEELRRVVPVLERLAGLPVSIDTAKAGVARRALELGAELVNDVTALRGDRGMVEVVAEGGAYLCLMHMQGEPRTMQDAPDYDDVVGDVHRFLTDRLFSCELAGIERRRVLVDPGFGFGKNLEHNLALLRAMGRFAELGAGAYAGVSRKGMIGAMTGRQDPSARVHGSVAAALIAVQRGAVMVRVHDVAPTVDALAVWAAVKAGDTAPRHDKPSMPRWPDDD